MTSGVDFAFVNWLVKLTDPAYSYSQVGESLSETIESLRMLDRLGNFLGKLSNCNIPRNHQFCDDELNFEKIDAYDAFLKMRQLVGSKEWFAVVIPSGLDEAIDESLCDPHLLQYLLGSERSDLGVILQLEKGPDEFCLLVDTHPILRTVIDEAINWPGILIWSPGGNSVFLPLSSPHCMEIDIEARLIWVFQYLNNSSVIEFSDLKKLYRNRFSEVFDHYNFSINVLHLSDLYIGSRISRFRLQRVKEYIRREVEDIGESNKILPAITGNLMESPSIENSDAIRSFWNFFSELGIEEPMLVLGMKDVRKDGHINENFLTDFGFSIANVIWHEKEKLAFILINTLEAGNIENGAISREQLDEISYELDRKQNVNEYKFIVLLHHHPIVHTEPSVLSKKFYTKIDGVSCSNNSAIKGAELLSEFLEKISVIAIIHGNSTIPFCSKTLSNIPVLSCGSSIGGNIEGNDGNYFFMNIVTVNYIKRLLTCRFMAFRKPEVGIFDKKCHQLLYRCVF